MLLFLSFDRVFTDWLGDVCILLVLVTLIVNDKTLAVMKLFVCFCYQNIVESHLFLNHRYNIFIHFFSSDFNFIHLRNTHSESFPGKNWLVLK